MRIRIILPIGLSLIIAIFFLCERVRYNVVSRDELLSIREKLKILSPGEREDLNYFINQVISFDQFSYPLVSCKPMSIAPVIVEETEDLPLPFREALKKPNHQRLKRGYLVWKKYESLFQRGKCILIDYSFLGRGRKELALICPELCINVIQEHLDDFQEVLGKPYRNDEIFWILTHPEHDDFQALIDHTRLIGILLGFGRNNSWLYERFRGGASRSDITWNQRPANDFLEPFNNELPWPGRLLSPNFACDLSSEETKNLKKYYNQARKTIRWTYFLRNKLEVTLALLKKD